MLFKCTPNLASYSYYLKDLLSQTPVTCQIHINILKFLEFKLQRIFRVPLVFIGKIKKYLSNFWS